jgi:ELWxxDGT repeat protein
MGKSFGWTTAGIFLPGLTYFIADDSTGRDLWGSDGSPAGTIKLTNQGGESGVLFLSALNNGNFLFELTSTATGRELWVSNCCNL